MSTRVDQLIEQFRTLSDEEMMEFERALAEKRWTDDDWDRQMRADAASGKFDKLIAEARAEHARGESLPFPPEPSES